MIRTLRQRRTMRLLAIGACFFVAGFLCGNFLTVGVLFLGAVGGFIASPLFDVREPSKAERDRAVNWLEKRRVRRGQWEFRTGQALDEAFRLGARYQRFIARS